MKPKNKNILLVEDDQSVADTIKEILEQFEYNVTISSRSTEALRLVHAHPETFDMVMSDLHMPNMNGIELAKEIHDVKTDMPFIICTGDNSIEADKIKKTKGINEVFIKPFPIRDLVATIKTF